MTNSRIKLNRPEENKRNKVQVGVINLMIDKFNASYYKVEKHHILIYTRDGNPCVAIFKGNSLKRKAIKFHTLSDRQEFVERTIKEIKSEAQRRAELRKPIDCEVGDVFVSSWGYDQTNVDFYQVIERNGKTGVTIRPIGARTKEVLCHDSRKITPIKDRFIGSPIRKRLNSYGVTIDSVRIAKKTDWNSSHYESSCH